jgi:hypothetical protein
MGVMWPLKQIGPLGGGGETSAVLVEDQFSGVNGDLINARYPAPINIPGNFWAANGSWQIQNNRCQIVSSSNGLLIRYNAGVSDCSLFTTLVTIGAQTQNTPSQHQGFAARWSGLNLLIIIGVDIWNNLLQITERNGGVFTVVASAPATLVNGLVLTATLSGTLITAALSNGAICSGTSSYNLGATNFGLHSARSTNVFDDFRLTT